MNISDKFLTALVGSAIAIVQVQLAIALSSQEVGQIAREITVVIAGPDGRGSGVIVDQNNDTYYVLTAYHVIKEPGAYEIHTPDGERYPVFRSQRIGNFDLALIWFTSKNNYQVAQQSQSGEPGLGAHCLSCRISL
jgi:S1-C subfamily serine protease